MLTKKTRHLVKTTEFLDTKEMVLPTSFQPIAARHFVFEVAGIDAFLVEEVQFSPIGASPSGTFEVLLHWPIAPSTAQQLEEPMKSPKNGTYRARLKILDPVGTVVSKTMFYGVKLDLVDYGKFSYNDNGIKKILATFSYRKRKLVF